MYGDQASRWVTASRETGTETVTETDSHRVAHGVHGDPRGSSGGGCGESRGGVRDDDDDDDDHGRGGDDADGARAIGDGLEIGLAPTRCSWTLASSPLLPPLLLLSLSLLRAEIQFQDAQQCGAGVRRARCLPSAAQPTERTHMSIGRYLTCHEHTVGSPSYWTIES
jgi:hypothetical protein